MKVVIGLNLLPSGPSRLIVCGGRKNEKMIDTYFGVNAVLAEELGWEDDAIEAQEFAYRCFYGLPISFPGTTGYQNRCQGAF